MKIAHFISNFPTSEREEVYGKSLAAYNLCLQLVNLGHEVHIFTISDTSTKLEEMHHGMHIHSYKPIWGYKSEKISLDIFTNPQKYNFDIVHIHSGISIPLFSGYRYAIKNKIPLIITWHGDSVREPKQNRYTGAITGTAALLYKRLVKNILRRADSIISVSDIYVDQSLFLTNFKEKTKYIPNGINLHEFQAFSHEECKRRLQLTDKNVILFLGSLFPIKGPDVLLHAIPGVLEREDNVLFIFAGGGQIDLYKRMAQELGVQDHTLFTGYLNEEKVLYMNASDIFILPSRMECFPLVNLEAMACGVPIIASNVGGVSDVVIDRKNGLLIPPESPETLSEAILNLIEDKQTAKQLGNNGRKIVEKFSWKSIAQATESIYNKVINEPR